VSIVQRISKPIVEFRRRKWSLHLLMGFLGLGIVSTVIVSWSLSITINVIDTEGQVLGRTHPNVPCYVVFHSRRFGSQLYGAMNVVSEYDFLRQRPELDDDERATIPGWTRFRAILRPNRSGAIYARLDIARGWPLPALSCSVDSLMLGENMIGPVKIGYGIDLGRFPEGTLAGRRVLGLKPIWLGFIVNSLCYSALMALLILILWTLRYNVRLARARCPICNYILQSQDQGCPECGWNRPEGESKAGDKE